MNIKYFDNAATTRVKEEVLKEMLPFLTEEYGNASSIYKLGRDSKRAMEQARKKVANLFNCEPSEIYFTSCGSESDNMALKGLAYMQKEKGTGKNHIITSKIEHPAILETCKALEKQGFDITYLNVDKEGFIDLNMLEASITDKTFLISIMFANNEIGTIEPIEMISKIAKRHKITFHTDAVQAAGNVEIDVKKLGIDMLSMSGHKIYAPKGVGAIYIKKGIEITRFLDGGHQEKNLRSGTENIAEIVGLGKACEIAKNNLETYSKKLLTLRNYFFEKIQEEFKEIKINGSIEKRLPGNCNICLKGVNSSELLFKLDEVGICASGGSACSSGDSSISHVLTAIGVESDWAKGALRITFGDFNTKEEVDYLIKTLGTLHFVHNPNVSNKKGHI